MLIQPILCIKIPRRGAEMIKGVNKKIIEINETENIYFEKAILYIRPKMSDIPQSHLIKEANFYLERNIPEGQQKDASLLKIKKILFVAVFISIVIALLALAIFLL